MTPEELRALRTEHVLTQKALAAMLGYQSRYISRLECGKEKITQRFEILIRSMLGNKKVKK